MHRAGEEMQPQTRALRRPDPRAREHRRRLAVLREQRPDHLLRAAVLAFAEMDEADVTAPVDEVLRGPVLVREGVPRVEVVVERDRVAHAQLAYRPAHVV